MPGYSARLLPAEGAALRSIPKITLSRLKRGRGAGLAPKGLAVLIEGEEPFVGLQRFARALDLR